MDLWVIFLTGLTTGGLTCLAIQGGLLASVIARPVQVTQGTAKARRTKTITAIQLSDTVLPILVFLMAKLLAHVALGFLLGSLGGVFQITPAVQGVIQIAVGVYLILTVLNMLNVHPIFRYMVIQPPRRLTRMVRNQAKSQDFFAPALLGAMTVFIPCGTTQAMEVLAVSSANPLSGALIMGVFVVGTMPLFLVLGTAVTRVPQGMRRAFSAATIVLLLVLGVVSLDGGLNLLGSPLAPSRLVAGFVSPSSGYQPVEAQVVGDVQEITIEARDYGYSPNLFAAQPGMPIRLRLVTSETWSCTQVFIIPMLGVEEFLPNTGEVIVDLPPQPEGTIYFSCGMGMYLGAIQVADIS